MDGWLDGGKGVRGRSRWCVGPGVVLGRAGPGLQLLDGSTWTGGGCEFSPAAARVHTQAVDAGVGCAGRGRERLRQQRRGGMGEGETGMGPVLF